MHRWWTNMARAINFNPGPATMPLAALERAQAELLDLAGSGMSVIEHSHRGKVYEAVHDEALQLVRELLQVPANYSVLFLQGGASVQFATIAMNLLMPGRSADYVMTGMWSERAYEEAKILGAARVAATTKPEKYRRIPRPEELELDPTAAYVHITSNNTVAGTQWMEFPDTEGVPLIADMSSDIFWRPIDVSKFGILYAGAQKNIGPSGITLMIARNDLVDAGRKDIPTIFRFDTHRAANSLYNTPPTFSVYLMRNVLSLLKDSGGLPAMEHANRTKAALLYEAIDARPDFYRCPVEKDSRSLMNVVFNLPSEAQEAEFLKAAAGRGMVGLKGHRVVGGIRASIYNACPLAWVQELVDFMNRYGA